MTPQFTYNANVLKVVDGDTVDLRVDLGFYTSVAIRTRLYGINAPETSTPEGREARDYLRSMLMINLPVTVRTFKAPTDKYGRWLALIYSGDLCINDTMIANGHAVTYYP